MGRRGKFKPKPTIPGADDPRGMGFLIPQFIEWSRVKGYAEATLEGREKYLRFFAVWLDTRGITRPQEVTRPMLERFQRYVFHYRKQDGKPLALNSQLAHILPVIAFYRWLTKSNYILANPAADLEVPRKIKSLPRQVLTAQEMEKVFQQFNINDSLGLRDRAIFEVFYSSGIRRGELSRLKIFDVDADRGVLFLKETKGWKDRMVPVGERALAWLEKYLREVRPSLAVPPDDGTLFLSNDGHPLTPDTLTDMGAAYVGAANLGKSGSCHIFRHTMATLMLEGGADIRYIQQMLGHENLNTTEIYTRVSIRGLQEVFKKTHPGANLRRNPERLKELEAEENSIEEREAALSDLVAEGETENPEPPTTKAAKKKRMLIKRLLGNRLKLLPGEKVRTHKTTGKRKKKQKKT
ncbi:MAG: site-specific tyrosine recombinase XerC [Patescibacteria group bacterium]